MGLNVIQGARISGAAKIIAIDVNQQRLEMARQFGATHLILADREDVGLMKAAAKVRELCGGVVRIMPLNARGFPRSVPLHWR